jgi:hypothetical protein
VSVFRPAVRVHAPDGREWEIYAYKIAVGERDDGNAELVRKKRFVRRVLDVLRDVPVAAVRALRSDEWTIEAITFMPQRQSYVWRTTREYRGQVLAQVEGNLARGYVPQQLRNATYVGWRRSAR